jgi:ArsR family transcriptional regulator
MEHSTPDKQNSLNDSAQLFKALGDPTRIRMLSVLRHGELCVCDIMTVLDLPQSTASRHLAYLRNAGWLTSRRQNKWMYYQLNTSTMNAQIISAVISHLATLLQLQQDYNAMALHLKEKTVQKCS